MTAASEPFKVFWQPGCSSCLRTKEFLAEHGVPFQSIDVLNDEGGMEMMAALGVRTVPIVSRGRDYVSGQILRDVAAFTGVDWGRSVLPVADLRDRIDGIMAGALRFAAQLPEAHLDVMLPDRPRSYRDLACHIFQIVVRGLLVSYGYLYNGGSGQVTFVFRCIPCIGLGKGSSGRLDRS